MDKVVTVTAPEPERIRRTCLRDGVAPEAVRARMAALGHPLLGDGKYGVGSVNRKYGETHQALYSYRLRFDFPSDAGILEYLHGREFQVDEVPFQKKYFS